MNFLFVFSMTLGASLLISEMAGKTVLSTSFLFLVVGVLGQQLGWFRTDLNENMISRLPEMALLAILFTDSMNLSAKQIRRSWGLPLRALGVGLPLTLLFIALILRFTFQMPIMEALIISAVLSPTDPVFAAGLVKNPNIPHRLRLLLNVESGLNDGLSLPLVLIFLAMQSQSSVHLWSLLSEIFVGVGLGLLIPWLIHRLERSEALGISAEYQPLFAVAVFLIVFVLARRLEGNEFLAVFAAGAMLRNLSQVTVQKFRQLGEPLAELLKLAAVLYFGSLFSIHFFANNFWASLVAALGIICVARPVALQIALWGSRLSWQERLIAAWFGPKGFASIVFSFLILKSGYSHSESIFQITSLVIVLSILLHSSTDVIAGRWISSSQSKLGTPLARLE